MTRITTRTPSTGKPIRVAKENVPVSYTTIAEAPDFSVPDASNKYPVRDPTDLGRAIRPGEVFFLTPLAAKNKDLVSDIQYFEYNYTKLEENYFLALRDIGSCFNKNCLFVDRNITDFGIEFFSTIISFEAKIII